MKIAPQFSEGEFFPSSQYCALIVRKDFRQANLGVSLPETAKIIGASQATVSRLVKRHGWKKFKSENGSAVRKMS